MPAYPGCSGKETVNLNRCCCFIDTEKSPLYYKDMSMSMCV